MTLTRPCGVMPSLRLVNPFRSQNSTVITALTLRCGQVWAIDQPFHDARINVFAKSFPDALVIAQLHDHSVERAGQLPDFVGRRYIDGSIEVARLDRARTLQQLPHRANDATADKVGENQSDNRGKQRRD